MPRLRSSRHTPSRRTTRRSCATAASSAASQCAAESLSAPSVMYFAQAKAHALPAGTRAPVRKPPCRPRRHRPHAGGWRRNRRGAVLSAATARTSAETRSRGGVASKGVTPTGKPSPLTSMSRWEKRLQATSVWAATVRLPAVPRLTTSEGERRRAAQLREPAGERRRGVHLADAGVQDMRARALSSWPRDSCGKAMTIKGFNAVLCMRLDGIRGSAILARPDGRGCSSMVEL